MPKASQPARIRVAVFAASAFQRTTLKRILETYGIIVLEGDLNEFEADSARRNRWDAILINVDEKDASSVLVDRILEAVDIPVLFNDAIHIPAADSEWSRKLVNKLLTLVYGDEAVMIKKPTPSHPAESPQTEPLDEGVSWLITPATHNTPADAPYSLSDMPSELRELFAEDRKTRRREADWETDAADDPIDEPSQIPRAIAIPTRSIPLGPALWTQEAAQHVWVLGASLGGLQAIKQFLIEIPSNLPVALILALHIGKDHIEGLIEQLKLVSTLTVLVPTEGHVIRHHQLVVIPPDFRIEINQRGRLELFSTSATKHLYNPCIDDIMDAVAKRYHSHCGAIVFSGMGYDGVKGSRKILDHGGVVWCQSRESSVVSGMIDEITQLGIASFSADPHRLSKHFVHIIQSKQQKTESGAAKP